MVTLKSTGHSNAGIAEILKGEGIKTSRSAVSLFVTRYRRTGTITDARRSGRKGILDSDDKDFIDDKLKSNELTSTEIKNLLSNERGVNVSSAIIRRAWRKIGWKHERVRSYCQQIRDVNKLRRLSFCLNELRQELRHL